MCTPAVVPLIATVAATAITYQQQQEMQDEQRKIRQEENDNQAALLDQANKKENAARDVADSQLQNFEAKAQTDNMQQLAQQREEAITPTSQDQIAQAQYTPANPGAPQEVSDKLAQALAGAITKAKANSKSLAGLSAYGDQAGRSTLNIQRTNEAIGATNAAIGALGRQSQNSANAAAGNLAIAGIPNRNASTVADLLAGFGQYGLLKDATTPKSTSAYSSTAVGGPDGYGGMG